MIGRTPRKILHGLTLLKEDFSGSSLCCHGATTLRTFLVAIDSSDAADSVIEATRAFARAFQAKVFLTHVFSPISNEAGAFVSAPDPAADILTNIQEALAKDGFNVDASKLCGTPAACIHNEAERISADCIVIGSHGHGMLYDVLVGSTAVQVLRNAPCSVLIVPAPHGMEEAANTRARCCGGIDKPHPQARDTAESKRSESRTFIDLLSRAAREALTTPPKMGMKY